MAKQSRQGCTYSVILKIKINADTEAAEFNLLSQTTYELASSWMKECESSLLEMNTQNVAVKCLTFTQSIHRFPVYWELSLRAY